MAPRHAVYARVDRRRYPNAARAAANIAAVSASFAVQSLNDSAAWYTSMPRPDTAFAPRDFAAAVSGVSAGL